VLDVTATVLDAGRLPMAFKDSTATPDEREQILDQLKNSLRRAIQAGIEQAVRGEQIDGEEALSSPRGGNYRINYLFYSCEVSGGRRRAAALSKNLSDKTQASKSETQYAEH